MNSVSGREVGAPLCPCGARGCQTSNALGPAAALGPVAHRFQGNQQKWPATRVSRGSSRPRGARGPHVRGAQLQAAAADLGRSRGRIRLGWSQLGGSGCHHRSRPARPHPLRWCDVAYMKRTEPPPCKRPCPWCIQFELRFLQEPAAGTHAAPTRHARLVQGAGQRAPPDRRSSGKASGVEGPSSA